MPKITIIDDDAVVNTLAENLYYRGYDIRKVDTIKEALNNLENILLDDLIILDIFMEVPEDLVGKIGISKRGGMAFYREIRIKKPQIPILVFTASQDKDIVDLVNSDKYSKFMWKYYAPSMAEIANKLSGMLGKPTKKIPPTIFIVHGQNEKTKLELKNYIQNTLKLPEPIILHEKPNLGRTIIEKFEDYAYTSNLIFVLLTPDDKLANPKDPDDSKRRARQNVIFEAGFFLGNLGRKTGRVLLLHQGPIELPTDLAGVVYIDISSGIEAAGEKIRSEINHAI